MATNSGAVAYSWAQVIGVAVVGALLMSCSSNPATTPQMRSGQVFASGAPVAKLNPTSLSFGYVILNVTSSPMPVVLSNTGTATLTIAAIKATCNSTFCFKQANACGTQLPPSKSCTIEMTFTPYVAGSATGTLSIYDNATGSPQRALLSGVGTVPCLPYGAPCSPAYNRCCPGLRCIYHPGSVRVGYSCGYGTAVREEYLERVASNNAGWLYLWDLSNADTVSVIDAARGTLLNTIAVGSDAASLAITPDGRKLYVAGTPATSVAVIDTSRNEVVKNITVGIGGSNTDVAISESGSAAYVADAEKKTVAVIDTSSDIVTDVKRATPWPASVELFRRCAPGVVASPDGRRVYVLNSGFGATASTTSFPEPLAALDFAS